MKDEPVARIHREDIETMRALDPACAMDFFWAIVDADAGKEHRFKFAEAQAEFEKIRERIPDDRLFLQEFKQITKQKK